MKKPVVPTLPRLRELCREWQEILRLRDWTVRVRYARGNGVDLGADAQGDCSWVLKRKEALIKILDPVDRDPEVKYFPWDVEVVLVHELLHLHFAAFSAKDDTPEDTAQEQAVHSLSEALVTLKRRTMKR